jgi:hypothetical protein
MPGMNLPKHPYERLYSRRLWGLIILISITIICSIIVIYIVYLSEIGEISVENRGIGLLLVLMTWFISTSIVSKSAFGKVTFGLGFTLKQRNDNKENRD